MAACRSCSPAAASPTPASWTEYSRNFRLLFLYTCPASSRPGMAESRSVSSSSRMRAPSLARTHGGANIMCLGVPGKVLEVNGLEATGDLMAEDVRGEMAAGGKVREKV